MLSKEQRLAVYQEKLLSWNDKINLIGPEAKANLGEHIGEALAAAEYLQPRGRVLDFGSGGGLPAIPMAIVAPEAFFVLVEADQRKWAFLKHVIRECELNCEAWGDRLHRLLGERFLKPEFSLVTSRAVGYPEEWFPGIRNILLPEGRVALFGDSVGRQTIGEFHKIAEIALPRGVTNILGIYAVPRETT